MAKSSWTGTTFALTWNSPSLLLVLPELPHITLMQLFVSELGIAVIFQLDLFPAQLLGWEAYKYPGCPASQSGKERRGQAGAGGLVPAAEGDALPMHSIGLSCVCAEQVV